MMRTIWCFTLVVLAWQNCQAQSDISLRGSITDAQDGSPLRFVNVRVVETRRSTMTDKMGAYLIRLPATTTASVDSVTVVYSLVGYTADTLRVSLRLPVANVALVERVFTGREAVVTSEDPAVAIMRRVIARKKKQTDSLASYTYLLYTKFVVATDTGTASRSTGRGDTTVFGILESYSRGYFERPDKYFNEILQRRQSANIPPQANLVAFGTNINAYDDVVTILNEEIETPFNRDALDHYYFVLVNSEEDDTVMIDVLPTSDSRRAFTGRIYVDQRTNSPLEVRLTPSKAVNLPFNASLTYRQRFIDTAGYIMPEALSVVSSMTAEILFVFSPRLDIDVETICYDYNLNVPIEERLFDQRRVEITPTANFFDSTYWRENQKLPLRPEEESAYAEIQNSIDNPDSLQNTFLDTYIGPITRNIAKLGRRPFSGIDDVFRYNRIHGVYLGIGLRFRPDTVLEMEMSAGYGFADQHFYGTAKATGFLDQLQKWSIDGLVYQTLQRRDNPNIVRTNLITFTSLMFGNDYGDYYRRKGAELGFSYSWGQLRFIRNDLWQRPNGIRLFVRSEDQRSAQTQDLWSLLSPQNPLRQNPEINDGTMRSVGMDLILSYSPVRLISRTGMMLHVETSQPSFIPSSFSFTTASWIGVVRVKTMPLWTLDLVGTAGWSWGDVPSQMFASLESSVSGLVVGSVFRGMSVKEFYGDRFATLSISHNFGEVIPGLLRIPDVASFGIEFILFGGVGWTSFSNQTLQFTKTALPTTDQTSQKLYYEVGVGINRVLLFFRLDVNARLSQRSVPQIRITLSGATF